TATNGQLKIANGSFNTGTNAFTAIAKNDLSIENVTSLIADTTKLTATTGDLTINKGTTQLASAELKSGNDIVITDSTQFKVTNELIITAEKDILISNVATTAGTTKLTAKKGDLTIEKGTLTLASLVADALNNISITNVTTNNGATKLTATNGDLTIENGILTLASLVADALNNIFITNVKTDIGVTNLTTTKGSLTIENGTTELESAELISGSDISISNSTKFNVDNNFNAIAEKDLLITNVTTTAGTTKLTAKTGELKITNGNAKLDNAIITALEGNVTLNVDIDINGNTTNEKENTLDIIANKNIFSGGKITVEQGNVNWLAKNGSILDQNGDSINLDAKNSDVTLTANSGIGTSDSIELLAKTLNIDVVGDGYVSLNLLSDSTTLNSIKTANGIIDINSIGNVTIHKAKAGGTGNDFVLGAKNKITFAPNSSVEADNRIVIVSQEDDIYSEATDNNNAATFETGANGFINFVLFTGSISGTKNIVLDGENVRQGFLAAFNKGKTNIVANGDVFIYDTSTDDFDFGTIVSQKRIAIMSAADSSLNIDEIIANKIDFDHGLIKLSGLTDQYYANVAYIIGEDIDKIISNNNSLFTKTFDLEIEEIMIQNSKKGAIIEINAVTIKSQTNLTTASDKLEIEQIVAGADSSLTHYGGSRESGGVADLTLVNDIIAKGNFIFKNVRSKEVYAYSNSINGSVRVINSYSPYRANYDINNVSLIIDSVEKERSQYYSYFNRENKYPDFRIWSLDGTHDFNLSREQLSFSNPNMLTLFATNRNLILNGNATTNTAFGELLTEYRHATANSINKLLLYSEKILIGQIEDNILNSQQVNIVPSQSTTINFFDIFNNDSPAIVPIINDNDDDDDDEEKLKEASAENNDSEPITISQYKINESE
ncbi:MAG: hypothetical protein LBH59_06645, partial [Planctomycetaceae bacterium]|nr:hypothetical protein [Planctomycetaceae bacterium]